MRRFVCAVVLLLAVSSAFAQEPPSGPTGHSVAAPLEKSPREQALEAKLNEELNLEMTFRTQLLTATQALQSLTKQLADMKAKYEPPPKDAPK